jgi:hypothetical protein
VRASARWRCGAIAIAVAGYLVSVEAAMAILNIDHADTATHYTAGQDAIGITTAIVGLGGVASACWIAGRWWKRPHLKSLARERRWASVLPVGAIADNGAAVIPFTIWWRQHIRGLFVSLPPSAGALVLFGGKGIDVGAAVLVALLVAGALVLAGSIWWSWATRALAVGDARIAWRPRISRTWRLLYLADLVDHRYYRRDTRLILTRAD